MTVTSKLFISFLIVFLFWLNTSALHSAEVLAQKPAWAAVEASPAAAPAASGSATGSAAVRISHLPTAHLLPDNPLYFLKTLKEKAQLLVTRNASSQADLLLTFSQKRLAEAAKVAEKGKIHISEKLLAAFGEDVKAAQEKIRQAKAKGEATKNLFLRLQETVAYQKSVLEKIPELGSFLVQIDESLREATPTAVPRVKISTGGGIFDWLRSLLGRKEILKPLAE